MDGTKCRAEQQGRAAVYPLASAVLLPPLRWARRLHKNRVPRQGWNTETITTLSDYWLSSPPVRFIILSCFHSPFAILISRPVRRGKYSSPPQSKSDVQAHRQKKNVGQHNPASDPSRRYFLSMLRVSFSWISNYRWLRLNQRQVPMLKEKRGITWEHQESGNSKSASVVMDSWCTTWSSSMLSEGIPFDTTLSSCQPTIGNQKLHLVCKHGPAYPSRPTCTVTFTKLKKFVTLLGRY
jgi:hypothetical protein